MRMRGQSVSIHFKTFLSLAAGIFVFLTLWWFNPSSRAEAYAGVVRGTQTYLVSDVVSKRYEFPPEHKKLHKKIKRARRTILERFGYTKLDAEAVVLARQELGKPYVWGGTGPAVFDCSGLVRYVWAKLGVILPHSTYSQWRYGTPVSYKDLREGDTVFFNGLGHEAMYVGGGYVIEAPHSGATVRIRSLLSADSFYGARRLR